MTDSTTLTNKAIVHSKILLDKVFNHDDTHKAVVVYDKDSTLSKILTKAYRVNLPHATFIDFHKSSPKEIRAVFDNLDALDMVKLSFRCISYTCRTFQTQDKSTRTPTSHTYA